MVGRDVGNSGVRGHVIHGDAKLTIRDFFNPSISVAFTSVYDLDSGRQRSSLTWSDIPLADGSFRDGSDGNSKSGRFYGPRHEEVGGAFERTRIVGALGAQRQ